MAKKRKKKDEELITNCDNPEEVVANCDHLDEPVTNCDQSKELVAKYDQFKNLKHSSSASPETILQLLK